MDNDSYSAPRAYSSNMEHTRALGSRRVPTHGHTHIYPPFLRRHSQSMRTATDWQMMVMTTMLAASHTRARLGPGSGWPL